MKRVFVLFAAVAIALLVAACDGQGYRPTPSPGSSQTPAPTEQPTGIPTESPTEAPTEAPTEPPTEAPTQAPTHGNSSTITLDDLYGARFEVTVTRVIDPAPGPAYSLPDGDRFVDVSLSITGVSGTYRDDVSSSISVVTSRGVTKGRSPVALSSEGTHLFGIELGPGQTITGVVTFVLLNSERVERVRYQPDGGSATNYAWWTINYS